MDIELLKTLGFSDKSAVMYLTLLSMGPSSVRTLSDAARLNRGTAYDSLKWLQEQGLADFYDKDAKQYFVANDPRALIALVEKQRDALSHLEKKVEKTVTELQALHHRGGERPVARYFEKKDIPAILEDVIATCEQTEDRLYRIYSAAPIREHLYDGFQTFSDVRVSKGIRVQVIALGEGGELRGLDERKWLGGKSILPTYIIIYPGKTAYVSINAKGELVGVIIENQGVFETQKIVFDSLWTALQ